MLHTVRPTWEHVWVMAAVLAAAGLVLQSTRNRWLRGAAPYCIEGAIIGMLYGLWQLAAEISVTDVTGAFSRAHWIERFQSAIHLPSEISVQQLVLGHRLVVEGANLYYASMHLTMMLVFLIWLFWRHRDQYRPVRTLLAWVTLLCLIVQLVPVAPPRMLPGAGFIDLALAYGQSIYGPFGSGVADQLSALPSVHVAWALLIAFFVLTVSPSRWRWLILLHPVATIFVVVATANHYWLDGISAGLLLAVALPVTDAIERRRARRAAERGVTVGEPREMLTVT